MLAPLAWEIYKIKVIPWNRTLVEKILWKYKLLKVISTHSETMELDLMKKYNAKSLNTKRIWTTEIWGKEWYYLIIEIEETRNKLMDLFKKRK